MTCTPLFQLHNNKPEKNPKQNPFRNAAGIMACDAPVPVFTSNHHASAFHFSKPIKCALGKKKKKGKTPAPPQVTWKKKEKKKRFQSHSWGPPQLCHFYQVISLLKVDEKPVWLVMVAVDQCSHAPQLHGQFFYIYIIRKLKWAGGWFIQYCHCVCILQSVNTFFHICLTWFV